MTSTTSHVPWKVGDRLRLETDFDRIGFPAGSTGTVEAIYDPQVVLRWDHVDDAHHDKHRTFHWDHFEPLPARPTAPIKVGDTVQIAHHSHTSAWGQVISSTPSVIRDGEHNVEILLAEDCPCGCGFESGDELVVYGSRLVLLDDRPLPTRPHRLSIHLDLTGEQVKAFGLDDLPLDHDGKLVLLELLAETESETITITRDWG